MLQSKKNSCIYFPPFLVEPSFHSILRFWWVLSMPKDSSKKWNEKNTSSVSLRVATADSKDPSNPGWYDTALHSLRCKPETLEGRGPITDFRRLRHKITLYSRCHTQSKYIKTLLGTHALIHLHTSPLRVWLFLHMIRARYFSDIFQIAFIFLLITNRIVRKSVASTYLILWVELYCNTTYREKFMLFRIYCTYAYDTKVKLF